jgi:hypothetical protein
MSNGFEFEYVSSSVSVLNGDGIVIHVVNDSANGEETQAHHLRKHRGRRHHGGRQWRRLRYSNLAVGPGLHGLQLRRVLGQNSNVLREPDSESIVRAGRQRDTGSGRHISTRRLCRLQASGRS